MKTKLEPQPEFFGPERSPDDVRADAIRLDGRLREITADMSNRKKSMFETLAALVGQPEETDRSRLVWTGMVNFANLRINGTTLLFAKAAALRATIALSVFGTQEMEEERGSVYGLECFHDIDRVERAKKISSNEAFSELAIGYHPKVRSLLEWIADPNSVDKKHRREALNFLVEHAEGIIENYDFEQNDEFDETGNVGAPFFYWKHPRDFESIISPLARFVFDRLEKYNEGELSLSDATPIILCRREECRRLTISQRRTKDFCSDSCRTLYRQKENAEAHAAYMREYRKKNYTKPFSSKKAGGAGLK